MTLPHSWLTEQQVVRGQNKKVCFAHCEHLALTHHLQDALLRQAVAQHGENDNWKIIATSIPGRSNKACRKVSDFSLLSDIEYFNPFLSSAGCIPCNRM